jgi:Rrf2 family protein
MASSIGMGWLVKLSSRSEYGIRALLELAQRRGQGPIQSREIAERQEIPEAYLNQLLLILRKAGIVQSVRGPAGGHLLARQPERVTLSEVIGALEGLPQQDSGADESGTRGDAWAVRWVGCQIDEAVANVLGDITLETLLVRKQTRDNILTYQI